MWLAITFKPERPIFKFSLPHEVDLRLIMNIKSLTRLTTFSIEVQYSLQKHILKWNTIYRERGYYFPWLYALWHQHETFSHYVVTRWFRLLPLNVAIQSAHCIVVEYWTLCLKELDRGKLCIVQRVKCSSVRHKTQSPLGLLS